MLLIKRIMAQIIDFMIALLLMFVTFSFIIPIIRKVVPNNLFLTAIAFVVIIGGYYLIQYPFMINGQTIGKGFFRLRIVSTDKVRHTVSVAVIIQREILCKLMSCYLICLPLFFGKNGGQDEVTHTKIIQF
ncbi:RDD family protein [Lapidilactobacillus bayanensis]|uniref:RDD family protein n=1 Tax=Lapidilactobacillus bayanensis TaxID=2485998 RepID=UPI000F7716E5|nr:RDD family protein [Lapidilactobacillus bayanensis]